MSSPTFLHKLPEEQFNKLSQEDIERIRRAEILSWNYKPHTKYYAVLTSAARRVQ